MMFQFMIKDCSPNTLRWHNIHDTMLNLVIVHFNVLVAIVLLKMYRWNQWHSNIDWTESTVPVEFFDAAIAIVIGVGMGIDKGNMVCQSHVLYYLWKITLFLWPIPAFQARFSYYFPGALMWKRFCGLRSHYNKVRKRKSGQGAPKKTDREIWLSNKMNFIRAFSKPDPGLGIGDVSIQSLEISVIKSGQCGTQI